MQKLSVKTSEIQVGDVVLTHGMRCLVDSPLEISKCHGVGRDGSHCRYVKALVLNRDDEATNAVPRSWTADWKRNGRYDALPHDGEHRWTIQGNDLASWYVEQ